MNAAIQSSTQRGALLGNRDYPNRYQPGEHTMLRWAAIFFVIALVAAVFGFAGIADSAAGIAKVLFVVFLVLAGISLLLGRRAV
jgi:uncharacterized membrane protein YtjA (UPF0391 family)